MDSTQEFNCIFCKESFIEKEELQIHFRKHGDPKFNQSVKNNKSRLSSDSQASGDNNEEVEKVSCDVCSDVFPTISKAITHKHKVHPDHDAKYFCPWCGKLFTMKHLYNKHIQTTHDSMEQSEETGFHCDYCEVDFFIPSAMVYHNKFFHRQDTELAVIGHSKKLKLFNQELLQLYYCPFCGEEYYNKVNLHKHMGDDHIDENQSPDDVLRCPLCDAIFYHLDAYELHLTFHSSKDTYSEENEMANDITEFSLETVPPIMEKVENDTQDDGESTNTMGIEELLQQAMNETNDGSNSEGAPRKKSKKHKKHKKSKKAAITLDEFLNMNQDVFGEDIDFQGIEVVPEQVVAKQLKGRRAQLKSKTGPKMLSKDLAKLKKQGIVVKKKSSKNINKDSGTINKGTPVRIAQNLVTNKPPVIQTKAITSDEVLTKLLNQGNSQIKIVKRSAQDKSISDLQMPSEDLPVVNERNASSFECISDKKIEEAATNTSNGEMNVGDNHEEHVHSVPAKTIDLANRQKDIITEECEINNKFTIEKRTTNDLSNKDEAEFPNSLKNTTDQNDGYKNSKDELKLEPLKTNVVNPLNALRNISQHLTIKSLSSPKNVQSEEKSYIDKNVHNPNCDAIKNKTEQNDENKILKESKSESLKTKVANPLNTLRNVSQHVTMQSLSSPKNVLSEEKPYPNNSIHNPPESDKEDDKHNDVIHEKEPGDVKSVSDQHENNSNTNSLNALKHLSHLITVKPVNKNATIAQNDITEKKTDTQEDSQNKHDDNCKHDCTEEPGTPMAVIKKESPNLKEHSQVKKETPTSLDAFKNISKNITIKSLSQKNENVADKHFNDRSQKGTLEDYDEDMDSNVKTCKIETENFNKTNTILTNPTSSQISVQNLKSHEIRNQPTSPLPKENKSAPENEKEKPDRQINFESNETAVKKESCTNILKHLPNLTAKPVTAAQNTSQKVQSSTQSMHFLKGNIIQKSVKKEINEEIEIFNIDDSDDEEANSQDSSIHQTNVKLSIDTARNVGKNDVDKSNDAFKNLSKNITIKSTKQQKPSVNENAPSPENVPSPENMPDDYAESNDSDDEVDINNTFLKRNIKPQVFKNELSHVQITSRNYDNTNINKSMDALKTLSKNITVKSNQQKIQVDKNVPISEDNMLDEYDSDHEVDGSNITLKHNIQKPTTGNKPLNTDQIRVEKTDMNKSRDAFKNLSKHITIKSSNQQKLSVNDDVRSLEEMLDGHHSNSNDSDVDTSDILQHNVQKHKNIQTMSGNVNMASRNLTKNYLDKSKEALKNLSKQITIKSTNQQKLLANKNVGRPEDMLDAISTFSDDEINVTKNIISKTIQKQGQYQNMIGTYVQTSKNFSNTEVHQSDTLKHLSKHVSIKSSNQQKLVINKKVPCSDEVLDFAANDFGYEVTRKPGPKSVMLQQKNKSLSKNITVKSENYSPKIPIKSQSTQGIKNNVLLDGYDSDSDSCPGNVKITEMSDDNENEASSLNKARNCQSDSNIIVQSPSDDEVREENFPQENLNLNKQSVYLDSLKNISKHITIKSRTDNNVDEENLLEKDSMVQRDVPAVPHVNKELSLKQYKQMKPGCRDDNETSTSRTINQSATNQKNMASSNRMNTVNKEVTVKTFQTETYIEEVTTTVTKTIRTVNQTVKQEVRNTSQMSSMPMIRPQRMPGIRPTQQRNNLHGTLVRQQAPTIGPRIRNPMTPIRPAVGAKGVVRPSNQSVPVKPSNQLVPVKPSNQLVPVRPSNQLVPVRPSNQLVPVRPSNQLNPTRSGLNVTRPSNPRTPVMKKIQASTSNPQKPVVGKPLKMSPNAQVQSSKRPVEDSIGHFSCFKKPKESLIPVSDIPVFTNKQDSGTAQTVQYASSSNMSRSNFTSTTKIVKGSSIVTSTQVKSEVNASSQQLSRLSNMSGLKIMKTSQTKQASQVEDKCEVSASKRTALEAIEKLQKSGLLVKKPRLEEDRFSDQSNSDVDDNFET